MTTIAQITAIQSKLGITADGKAGPQTWAAIFRAIVGEPPVAASPSAEIVSDLKDIDPRSAMNIVTLRPEVQPYAVSLIHEAAALGIVIKVISATRTSEEQDALFAKGRTAPGPIVTNARAGHSNHNFGIAFDIGVFRDGTYIPEGPEYNAIGAIGIRLGLAWGGSWQSITDEPHFELRPTWAAGMSESQMLAELRAGRAPFTA